MKSKPFFMASVTFPFEARKFVFLLSLRYLSRLLYSLISNQVGAIWHTTCNRLIISSRVYVVVSEEVEESRGVNYSPWLTV